MPLVFSRTKSGAALVNDSVFSPAVPGFPIGGVGASGCEVFPYDYPVHHSCSLDIDGYYAGKQAFEQFTHYRVMLDNPKW